MPSLLFVITDLEVGGVPLHLLRLATGLRAKGYAVQVVSLAPAGPVGDRLRDAGIAVRSCGARHAGDWRAISRLTEYIADVAPDLVHAFLFHANLACRLACVLGGFPVRRLLCEIQTVEIERRWHLAVDRWTYRLCALTVGNSQSVIDHLHGEAAIPYSRLRAIPGGIDVAAIAAADPVPLHDTAEERVLLWVGRMDPIKGLDTLINAVSRLPQDLPCKLVLVGDGPEREKIDSLVERLSLEDRIEPLGRRDDVPGLMRAADLFVFPSRTEGMPNVLLEAMAAGLPIVTTDVSGCHDLVTDGVTGRLVPADDPIGLANTIVQAFADQEQTRSMAEAARTLVGRTYTLAACLDRYENLYRELIPTPALSSPN